MIASVLFVLLRFTASDCQCIASPSSIYRFWLPVYCFSFFDLPLLIASVLFILRFTASDYLCSIFRLFFPHIKLRIFVQSVRIQRMYKDLVVERDIFYFVKKNSDSAKKFSETDIITNDWVFDCQHIYCLISMFFNRQSMGTNPPSGFISCTRQTSYRSVWRKTNRS